MKKRLLTLGCILCALIVGGCAGYIGWYFYSKQDNERIYEKLKEEVKETPTPSPTEAPQEESTPLPTQVPVKEEIPIDFAELQKINADIYAWIRIEGTQIDYPVVQRAGDDTYYLNHTIEGKEGYPGSIYSESVNRKDFSDFNTILYGHNMKDGSMFQNLHNYQDPEYMKSHPTVIVYTPDQVLRYRIFAAVTYNDTHLAYAFDYQTSEGRQAFLDSIQNTRQMSDVIDRETEVTEADRILTLSTCIGGQPEKRLLVEAVLEDE